MAQFGAATEFRSVFHNPWSKRRKGMKKMIAVASALAVLGAFSSTKAEAGLFDDVKAKFKELKKSAIELGKGLFGGKLKELKEKLEKYSGDWKPIIGELKGKAKKAILKLHQRWEKARALLAEKGKKLKLHFIKNLHKMHLKLKEMIAKVKAQAEKAKAEPAKEPAK
jgi:hypothetical protein